MDQILYYYIKNSNAKSYKGNLKLHNTNLKQPGHKPNTSISIYSTPKQVF